VWSHDGSTVAYRSAGGSKGSASLLSKATNGLQPERAVTKFTNASDIIPNSWSRDDQLILCTVQTSVGYDLQVVPSKGGSPVKLQLGGGNQQNGMISPDGRWVAYESDESGSWEIYVSTFPGAAGKWQVSRGGGTEPRWRGDGKEIFYIGPNGTMMAVPVNAGESFATGSPVSLFQFNARPPISSTDVFSYDVSKDGKRFLVNRYAKPDSIAPLTIILHADTPPTE
jgi:Tol biopolymer transport system component